MYSEVFWVNFSKTSGLREAVMPIVAPYQNVDGL